ncbi:MAG: hypothetical protein Q7T55_01960 [Solirubrobacteraceae bacterium]|nr:hypothetical protein [Solirubrobacteraceae bacterium]
MLLQSSDFYQHLGLCDMSRQLIATISSPTGRHSAKVYHDRKSGEYRSIFYVDGIKSAGADALTDFHAEAIEVTGWSLRTADEMYAGLQARKCAASLMHT